MLNEFDVIKIIKDEINLQRDLYNICGGEQHNYTVGILNTLIRTIETEAENVLNDMYKEDLKNVNQGKNY